MTLHPFTLGFLPFALFWCGTVAALAVGLGRLRKPAGGDALSLTILVAARNEAANIRACLAALAAQVYPTRRLETVIIDDGSTDGTAELAKASAQGATNLRVLSAPPPPAGVAPKKNALLVGIAATEGEIILTTDADCRPGPGWAKGMAAYFEPGVAAVVGHSPLPPGGASPIARFDAFVNAVVAAGSVGLGYPATAVGRNFAYRRASFAAAEGFGATLEGASGDDDLLLQRIASTGGDIRFAADPETFVPAEGATSFREWIAVKRRHLSAGRRYRGGLIALSASLYLFNAGLVISAWLALGGIVPLYEAASIWGLKAIFDGWALARGARLLHERNWLPVWIAAEILSPLIFTLLTPLSLFGNVRWKGRDLGR